MPLTLFGWDLPTTDSMASSKSHRKVTRFASASQLFTLYSPETQIIGHLVTGFSCLNAVFRKDIKPYERLINFTSSAMAFTLVSLSIYLYYEDKSCDNSNSKLCMTFDLLNDIYNGLVIANFGVSETNKDSAELGSNFNGAVVAHAA